MIEPRIAQEQVDLFLSATMDARALSEKCRDYMDHKQWTEAEVQKLKKRNQAPIVVNRIRPKVKGLVGLYNMRQSDPKAYPRTQKHEKSAHAITDALRYVADDNDFQTLKLEVCEEFFVEGYSGAIVEVKKGRTDTDVRISNIPFDRIFFDPHSRKKDFSDARYMGYYMWLYEDEAKELFPDSDIDGLINAEGSTDETTEDRPRWVDLGSRRIRIAVYYGIHKGQWHFGILTHNEWLIEPQISPYLDDEGEPTCPIELVSANIDRDNNRYGEVAGFLDQQDEINHRRSKWLFSNSSRQTFGRKGTVSDVPALKRELAKPDGHVEFNGEKFGEDFGVLPTNDMVKAQIDLYYDAKAELDSVSYNAQLAGERQSGDLSGRAIEKLQAAGTIELNSDYTQLSGWEKRVYRQIWARIKQFWTGEKWIRVTDDEDSLRWIGLNTKISTRVFLEEKINDKSLPLVERKKYAASYTFLTQIEQGQDLAAAEQATAALETPIASQNPVPEIDVDIILDQSFDSINTQQEQFQAIAQFASSADIDIIELIELSELRGKDKLIEKIERRRAEASGAQTAEQQANQAAIELETKVKAEELNLKAQEVQIKQYDAETKRMALTQTERAVNVSTSPDTSSIDRITFEREKHAADMKLKREEIAAKTKLEILKLNSQKPQDKTPAVNVYDKEVFGQMQEAINAMGQAVVMNGEAVKSSQSEVAGAIKELATVMSKPKEIRRNNEGQVVGIE
jgi:hypothetical protein